MAVDTLINLQNRIDAAKAETKLGGNSKLRVFNLLDDIIDTLKSLVDTNAEADALKALAEKTIDSVLYQVVYGTDGTIGTAQIKALAVTKAKLDDALRGEIEGGGYISIMNNVSASEANVIKYIKYIEVIGDTSNLKLATVYNTVELPKKIILKKHGGEYSLDFTSNYIERTIGNVHINVGFDWDKFILDSAQNVNFDYTTSKLVLTTKCFLNFDSRKEILDIKSNAISVKNGVVSNSFFNVASDYLSDDEIACAKAIKSIWVKGWDASRKYSIRFICVNDTDYGYNICIADKNTGVELTFPFTNKSGLTNLVLTGTFGTNSPVTINICIDYSELTSKTIWMNRSYGSSNLVISAKCYIDKTNTYLADYVLKTTQIAGLPIGDGLSTETLKSAIGLDEIVRSTAKTASNTFAEKYIGGDGLLYSLSGLPNFVVKEYQVTAGVPIVLYGLGVRLLGSYPLAMFKVTSGVSGTGTILLNGTTTPTDFNLSYTPAQNGYIFIALITTLPELICYNTEVVNNIIQRTDYNALKYPLKDESIALLGDSIMMLMNTNTISGTNYDNQNWDALKIKLSLSDVINCGLGGATIAETTSITNTPHPDDIDNPRTTCISNEVRWLKRLTDAGRKSPKLIVVWAGTNSPNQPSTDNFDAIMALSWSTLSDDSTGASYRQTFYGGLRYTIESAYRNYPNANIFIIGPAQAKYDYRSYNELAKTRDSMKKMASRFACPFFNPLDEMGVVDQFETMQANGRYLADGLHPNANGKIVWLNYLVSIINRFYFSKS